MKKAILFWLFLFLLVGPALSAHSETSSESAQGYGAQQQEPPSTGAILGDFIFIRPFGVIAVAVGVVATVATLPIAVPSGSVGTVAHKLVAKPFAYLYATPRRLPHEPRDRDISMALTVKKRLETGFTGSLPRRWISSNAFFP